MKNKITIGQKESIINAFTEEDVFNFCQLSHDCNPIHQDEDYAKTTIFKSRIVPGPQAASLFGGLLGSKLPGKGTVLLGQTLVFKRPVYINEEVQAVIEVVNIRKDKPIITFKTTCYNSAKEILIDGEAVVKYQDILL